MFGSLVVILPTVHEGGSLVFRHHDKEWTFDSAKAVSSEPTPHAAYVAFFSDVEHEVLPVTSGHRVTLTYNLYFAERAKAIASREKDEGALKDALRAFLKDNDFLPQGGFLGFGLNHQYPFSADTTKLTELVKCLKGSDAALYRTCDSLALDASLKTFYVDRYDETAILSCLIFKPNSTLVPSFVTYLTFHCMLSK